MKVAKGTSDFLSVWFLSRADDSTQDPNVGFVETLYQTCSAALVYLWKSRFRLNSDTLHKRTLKKDVASIRLWEENFPSGRLDHILGESSDLKINVLESLIGIGKILAPYFADSAQNESSFSKTMVHELETQLEKARIMLGAEERSDSSSDGETSDASSSTTERQENRLGCLHCYIGCLVDLAPVIEKYLRGLHRKVEQPIPVEDVFRLSHEAQPFAMRIRDRFKNAPVHLVERLAEANWERSTRIRAQRVEEGGLLAVGDAQTLFKPSSLLHDSGIGSSISKASQYAATAASHTSFLSNAGEEAHGRPRIPPLPQEYGAPFECDYCGRLVSMRGRIQWKMHVFADLQSYLCTHEACRDGLKTFPTRKLWADHEVNEHFTLLRWRCFTCRTTTPTQQLFVDHMTLTHGIVLTGHRLKAAIAEAQETYLTPEFEKHKCALCSQSGWQTKKAYATHVGKHLEEISLACLPRDEAGSGDDDLDTDTSSTSTRVGARARHLHTTGALIVRFEMPIAVWCTTCKPNETLIGQGVRFNAEKKKVGNYHSTPIYSFRMKHTACGGWIEIQTDPQNTAYIVMEGGRKRDTGDNKELQPGEIAIRPYGLGEQDPAEKDPFAKLEGKVEDKHYPHPSENQRINIASEIRNVSNSSGKVKAKDVSSVGSIIDEGKLDGPLKYEYDPSDMALCKAKLSYHSTVDERIASQDNNLAMISEAQAKILKRWDMLKQIEKELAEKGRSLSPTDKRQLAQYEWRYNLLEMTAAKSTSPVPGQPDMAAGMSDSNQVAMQQRQLQQSAMLKQHQHAQQCPESGVALADDFKTLSALGLDHVSSLVNHMPAKASVEDVKLHKVARRSNDGNGKEVI